MPIVTFHNAARHAWGVWLTRLLPITLAALTVDRLTSTWPWYWPQLAPCAVMVAGLLVLLSPLWVARFRTLTIEGGVLTLTSGWLAPEVRTTTIDKVTSVQVDEPLAQRLSGVRAVTIMTSGAESAVFEMPAMRPEQARQLERILTTSSAASHDPGKPPTAVTRASKPAALEHPSPGTTIYKATAWDIAATAGSGGYVVILLAAAFGLAQDVQDTVAELGFDMPAWAPSIGLAAAAVLGPVGVSVMVSLRFRGFSIDRAANGHLEISYGAVERVRHVIAPGQVVAVSLVRTPVDLLFGTTRLVLSTGQPRTGNRQRVSFPSMPRAAVGAVVERATQRELSGLFVAHGVRWAVGVFIVASVVLTTAALVPTSSAAAQVGAAATALLVTSVVVRYALAVAEVPPAGDIVFRTAALSSRVTYYRPGALNAVVERSLPGLPVNNLNMSGWAHGRVVHRLPVRSPEPGLALRSELRAQQHRPTAVIDLAVMS